VEHYGTSRSDSLSATCLLSSTERHWRLHFGGEVADNSLARVPHYSTECFCARTWVSRDPTAHIPSHIASGAASAGLQISAESEVRLPWVSATRLGSPTSIPRATRARRGLTIGCGERASAAKSSWRRPAKIGEKAPNRAERRASLLAYSPVRSQSLGAFVQLWHSKSMTREAPWCSGRGTMRCW